MTSVGQLEVNDLRKSYGHAVALDDVTFALAPGEFLTLLGPSGSGKTTTLMAVAGFVQTDAGSIKLDGRDLTRLPPERRDFGIVFQGYALFPHMTVAENVAFPLQVRGVSSAERRSRVRAALDRVKLTSFSDRKPRELSGGQQQRVALARALVYEPRLLLLDEPLSALDRKLRAELQWELRSLHRDLGVSFLYVTHDQEEALTMSDRVAVFDRGRIVQCGTPDTLFERPATRFVADFFGKSNFFPARMGSVPQSVEWEGGTLDCGASAHFSPGEELTISVRPHRLTLVAPGTAPLGGVIKQRSYAGTVVHCLIQTRGGTEVLVETPALQGYSGIPDTGQSVGIQVDRDAVTLLPR